jgi:hypothetical protein
MENYEAYLKRETGHEWDEINSFYLHYRLQNSPHKFLCVFTPDDIGRDLNPRYYIPRHSVHLHDPGYFVTKYLNARKQLIKTLPPIEINLEKLLPKPFTKQIPPLLCAGTFKFIGTLTFVPPRSQSVLTLQNKGFSLTHQFNQVLDEIISSYDVGIDFKGSSIGISVSSSITGPLGDAITTSLSLNSFSVEYKPHPISWQYHGWDIIGIIGCKVEGAISPNNSSTGAISAFHPTLIQTPNHSSINTTALLIGVGAIGAACVIFTEGVCLPVFMGAATSMSLSITN